MRRSTYSTYSSFEARAHEFHRAIYVGGEYAGRTCSTTYPPAYGSFEEYARILDVVTKYPSIMLAFRFFAKRCVDYLINLYPAYFTRLAPQPLICLPHLPRPSRLLYGQGTCSASRFPIRETKGNRDAYDGGTAKPNEDGSWSAQEHFTNANHHSKHMVFLLFINNDHSLCRLCVLSFGGAHGYAASRSGLAGL